MSTQSGCSWTASSGANWIHITSGTSGSGSGSVVFNADAYSSGSRTGTLTVAGHTVSVTQSSGGGGGFTITPETPAVCQSVTFTAPDGVSVKSWDFGHANCQGNPANTYGSSICGMNPAACSSVTWSFPAAGTYTVTMTPVSGGPVSQQVTVSGSSVSCNLRLTADTTQFPASGGRGSINTGLDSSCSWTASSNASSWLHVTTASGSGNGPASFTVDANTGTESRSGKITVAVSGATSSVTITQAGTGSSGSGSGVLSATSLISVAANAAGNNGTDWKTELCIYNPNPTAATFKIKLLPDMTNDGGGTVVPVNGNSLQAVAGLGTWCSDDVLASMGDKIKGALVVDLQDPANYALGLAVTSRTYTPSPNGARGTYGQFVPALPLQGSPVHQLILTGLHSWGDAAAGEGFRTNVGLVNQSDQVVPRIYIKVYDSSGNLVGKYINKGSGDTFTSLGAHGFVQYDKILSKLDHPQNELQDFTIVITFTDVAGKATAEPVTAYGTVVDNATGDATFIPAVKVP
ncbi:MAG: BACON domain-containing protein [Acidobacteria bacterium]|nr:BACON domain-containing protein [Acidobacteriota bacterium]